MQYLLLIYGDETAWSAMSEQDRETVSRSYVDYSKWLADQGWMRAGDPLHPTSEATTVRIREGKTLTTDGPFAETKEQLGGYYLIECGSLDDAIEAASRLPGARSGSIEIRPVQPMMS